MPIPDLPENIGGVPWPPNIIAAHHTVNNATTRASALLRQANQDPLRLKLHLETLLVEICPILVALENNLVASGLPHAWLVVCAEAVADLVKNLHTALENAQGRYGQILVYYSL